MMLEKFKHISEISKNLDEELDLLKLEIEEKQKEYQDKVSNVSKITQITEGLNEEEFKNFIKEPYAVLPTGKQEEWFVAVPKFIRMNFGWLDHTTETFNVFRINKFMKWLGNIPLDIDKEILEKPTGKYKVIVIDPPWNYQDDSVYDADGFRGTCLYPTMSIEQIKEIKLPVEDDCVLWLWTTNKHIFDCRDILNEWGFEIKSIVTWDKEHIAIGRWLRSQTEHCILAIKGKPYFNNTKWSTLIREKRTTHSTKPEIFYKMVDEICAGRKLDYFARKKREGWDVYGDEVK